MESSLQCCQESFFVGNCAWLGSSCLAALHSVCVLLHGWLSHERSGDSCEWLAALPVPSEVNMLAVQSVLQYPWHCTFVFKQLQAILRHKVTTASHDTPQSTMENFWNLTAYALRLQLHVRSQHLHPSMMAGSTIRVYPATAQVLEGRQLSSYPWHCLLDSTSVLCTSR